jgi:hypothetical protein
VLSTAFHFGRALPRGQQGHWTLKHLTFYTNFFQASLGPPLSNFGVDRKKYSPEKRSRERQR